MKNLGNINDNKDITTKEYIDTELSSKADSSHNHNLADLSEKSYNSLTDKPTSMPADGGNADTVDNISSENLVYCQEEGEWHNTLSGAYGDEKGYLDGMFVNKFDFFPVSNIFVEKSSDGNTWSETNEYSDQQMQKFVGGDSGSNIYIPNTGTIGAGYRRFTFTQNSYVFLNALYLYTTCVSGTLEVKVEKRSFDTQEWITIKDFSSISGWPSHHILKHSYIPFNDRSGQYDKLRLTFYGETTNETYPNHTLYKMQWWGSYPAGKRTLHHINEVKDVFFPAKMYAEGSQEIWHAGNDGSGSGLDADKLDNQEGTHYLDRSNHTGNQPASTISDFDTEVSNNPDVDANTTARHIHSNKTILDNISSSGSGIIISSTERTKLSNIEENANNYSLPIATDVVLGGILSGTDITIDASGNVSINDDSHNHIISNIDNLQSTLDGKSDTTHDHNGVYEPADSTILKDADIGVTIQAHDSNTVIDSAYVHTDNNYTTAEKNKLSGIEENATADQTADEILTAIKTVDGNGSGLDAELINGQKIVIGTTEPSSPSLYDIWIDVN